MLLADAIERTGARWVVLDTIEALFGMFRAQAIVRDELVRLSADPAPPGLPVPAQAATAEFRLLTRGAERPGSDEVADNPRAASARLRAAERIREAA